MKSGDISESINTSARINFELKIPETGKLKALKRPVDKFIAEIVSYATDMSLSVSKHFNDKKSLDSLLEKLFNRVKGGKKNYHNSRNYQHGSIHVLYPKILPAQYRIPRN